MLQAKGKLHSTTFRGLALISYSILEYLSREDAERAVKELDGRDLRGQPVRVALDREVRLWTCSLVALNVHTPS